MKIFYKTALVLMIMIPLFSSEVKAQIPEWLHGTWSGDVQQEAAKGHLHYSIRIACQDYSCKVQYPSLQCEGNWKLVEAKKNKIILKEHILENTEDCLEYVDIVIKYKKRYILYKSKGVDSRFYNSKAVIYKK